MQTFALSTGVLKTPSVCLPPTGDRPGPSSHYEASQWFGSAEIEESEVDAWCLRESAASYGDSVRGRDELRPGKLDLTRGVQL
jgi:hypothetical protein